MFRRTPRIGINCDVEEDGERPRLALRLEYPDAVAAAGGEPVIIPPVAGAIEELLRCDGLLLIGGGDYRSGVRGKEPPGFTAVAERRERADLALAAGARKRALPTFGICGGFQLLVLSEGGSLYGDLASELGSEIAHQGPPASASIAKHWIEMQPEDGIGVAAGRHLVNSSHHQGIRALPAGWQVLARSEDGLVEAAAARGRFCIGVQWHPERERELPINRALFDAFLRAAAESASGDSR
ncbi:MAG: gamma-glutamyl-gamma-aminobutyrate hydrolase family protein [Planctomycetes bacterium]|nr:gamma-glutamyl-gamma-aminobutyrate hydrolase family protein [Planctomycetota bacterium]